LKLGRELGLLDWIAYDKGFKPGSYDCRFKQWTEKGFTAICTVIQKGEMRSFQDLKNLFDLENQDLFRYMQMRDYYAKKVQKNEDDIQPIVKIIARAYHDDVPKVVSTLYSCLMEAKKDSTLYVKTKELNERISDEMWYDMWKMHQTTTQSHGWREFLWKNQICFFYTPKITCKQTNKHSTIMLETL